MASDPDATNAPERPSYEWKFKSPLPPPRIFTTAGLSLYYHARQGGWFELVFTSNSHYLARRVVECPPEAKLNYGLDQKLVDACRGLDLLPKEEE